MLVMVPFLIVFAVAALLILVLAFAVKLPIFESKRARGVTIVVVILVWIGSAVGLQLWASSSADDKAQERSRSMRVVLERYRERPQELVTDDPPGLGVATVESAGGVVLVSSEVNELHQYRCVRARVSLVSVTIRTDDGKCGKG
jgi:hypothetical protein